MINTEEQTLLYVSLSFRANVIMSFKSLSHVNKLQTDNQLNLFVCVSMRFLSVSLTTHHPVLTAPLKCSACPSISHNEAKVLELKLCQ